MRQLGLSLIELMISMVLGLVLIAGVVNIFTATRQVYRSNEGLSQLQESTRIAFEMLARDLRQAGLAPCGNPGRIANVLKDSDAGTLLNWVGFTGFDGSETVVPGVTTGSGVGERVAGSSAILVQSTGGTGFPLEGHQAASATMMIASTATDFASGDVLLVCDIDQSSLFQVNTLTVAGGKTTITHNKDSGSPGNCSQGLGFPTNCSTTQGNPYTYPPNAYIGRFYSSVWYVGNNGRPDDGGLSLYRARMDKGATVYEEIVSGISGLVVEYHVPDADGWSDAASITDWASVDALKLTFTMVTADTRVSTESTGNGRLQRTVTHIVALRNRIP